MTIDPSLRRAPVPAVPTSPLPNAPRNVNRELERLRARSALQAAHLRRTGRPPASPATSRATSNAWRQAATRVAKAPICKDNPEAFALPDQPELSVTKSGALPAATFAELAAERRYVQARVRVAKVAINMCERCPILAQCRSNVLADIDAGSRPIDTVVAGVAWTSKGLPDPHVHDRVTATEQDQYTLDLMTDGPSTRTDPATSWIPAGLEPLPAIDEILIEEVLSDRNIFDATNGHQKWIAQSQLDQPGGRESEGREVIPYAEEAEIARRAVARDMAPNHLAAVLGCGWERAADLMYGFGAELPNINPSATASRQRAVWLARTRHAEQKKVRLAQASAQLKHATSA